MATDSGHTRSGGPCGVLPSHRPPHLASSHLDDDPRRGLMPEHGETRWPGTGASPRHGERLGPWTRLPGVDPGSTVRASGDGATGQPGALLGMLHSDRRGDRHREAWIVAAPRPRRRAGRSASVIRAPAHVRSHASRTRARAYVRPAYTYTHTRLPARTRRATIEQITQERAYPPGVDGRGRVMGVGASLSSNRGRNSVSWYKGLFMDFTGVEISPGSKLDYPTAWKIQREVGASLVHHPRCSSVPGWSAISGPGLLCDCGSIEREYERRLSGSRPSETS